MQFLRQEELLGIALQSWGATWVPENSSRPVTRSFPAEVSKRWKVLPFRVAAGHLYVVGTDVSSDKMNLELKQFSSLELRFHLVTPTDFAELAAEYLP